MLSLKKFVLKGLIDYDYTFDLFWRYILLFLGKFIG